MLRRNLLILCLIVALLNSVGVVSATENNLTELNISPEIQGEERTLITQVMNTLDPMDQENVVFITEDGRIYANKPELKLDIIKWEKVKGNVYRDSKGNEQAFPQNEPFTIKEGETKDVGILAGGGPYRRIRSITGYSWTSAYIHLAGGSDVYEVVGDTAYVYTGGIGSTGVEVDAGLQHSPTYDNWSFYLKAAGNPYTTTPRFKSNQDVFVKFYVPSNGNVALSVTGYDVNNIKRTISYVMEASGFKTDGSGCRIKRCTTIAQTNQNFSSGSWHTNAHWYSCKVGTSSTSNHAWNSTDIYEVTNYPNNTHVVVDWVSWAEETDNIYLNL
ncbi:MAG: hypothetical protein Q7J85_04120 [Bacillota bacterium]|nr:hypothetical protein [Bacillota bacterium]